MLHPIKKLNIAVIGGGVAGIVSAYLLGRNHEVTIFEKNDYLGGHTHTSIISDGPDKGTPVDTGFIVCNDKTYTNFQHFIKQLGIKTRPSDMSFGVYKTQGPFFYSSDVPNGLFAQRRNLFRPSFYKMIFDILRFQKLTNRTLKVGLSDQATLGDFLKTHHFGRRFIDDHIIPLGAAIWSTSLEKMLEYPAYSFLGFIRNHGLADLKATVKWQTIVGGSHSYVKAFETQFKGKIILNVKDIKVKRISGQILVSVGEKEQLFDEVIIATHADQALNLINDPTLLEKELLSAWEYSSNETVLHTDKSVMPPVRRAWASWNYLNATSIGATSKDRSSLTYFMNRLMGLKTHNDWFVTLNATGLIMPDKILHSFIYEHPVFTNKSLTSQKRLQELNGQNHTYFCGSYFGYGFHEDAVKSALHVAKHFGEAL